MPPFAYSERNPQPQIDLKEYNHLRTRILYNAPALHGASPRVIHHGYAVVTARIAALTDAQHQAALIAYSGPNGSTTSVLLRKSAGQITLINALQDLLASMERDLWCLINQTVPGQTIDYQVGPVDGDNETTPKARKPIPRKSPLYAVPAPLQIKNKAPPKPKVSPVVVPEIFRGRRPSHQASVEYLRSQGFATQDSPPKTAPGECYVERRPLPQIPLPRGR
ncbi:hypothetical protein P280DRAFT_316408 [Massarina eburnea CBS 473.64]|uniref:Uncharacterized protein n=1 Tax=Massarina eburnea CBS 473.64 TaxID=1395130 RepID=A0A6A6S559_9PLEO|nr:hypothetical protein P280DRAFT_316408 [Massarina eburnea CBS 473.64]